MMCIRDNREKALRCHALHSRGRGLDAGSHCMCLRRATAFRRIIFALLLLPLLFLPWLLLMLLLLLFVLFVVLDASLD